MKQRLIPLLLAAFLLFSAAFIPSCSQKGLYSEGSGELKIVASFFPAFDLARQIAKENATYTVLQTSGADLHSYSPTASALTALSEADVFICVGGISDSIWLDDVLRAVGNEDLTVIKMSDHAEPILAELEGHSHSDYCHAHHTHSHGEEHSHGDAHSHGDGHDHESDEHIWTSLKAMATLTEAVASAFAEADPENADIYLQNAALYRAELNLLDARYEAVAALSESKTLIFADRFPFVRLTADYGLCHYAAFSGCSSESEASFASFVKLSEAVTENGAKYVLVTENGDQGLAKALGEQTGCGILTVNSMQSVSRREIKEGATYLQIMNDNLAVIGKALGVSD